MAGKTLLLANRVLDMLLRGETFSAPAGIYLALYETAPTEAGTDGEELSALGYERQLVTFAEAADGATANTNLVDFGTPSIDWGIVRAFAFFDAQTDGEMLFFTEVPLRNIQENAIVQVQIGDLRITED